MYRVDAYTQTLTRWPEQLKRVSGSARPPHSLMTSTAELLTEAEAVKAENPKRGEAIYKQILDVSKSTVNPDELRDQETALVKLGELYKEQKYVHGAFSLLGLLSFLSLFFQKCSRSGRGCHAITLFPIVYCQGQNRETKSCNFSWFTSLKC